MLKTMLKKKLSNEEALSLAKDLCLCQFIDVNNLIEGLHIEQNKELKVCLIATDKQVVEHVLAEQYGIPVSLCGESIIRISVKYGDGNYTAITDYGEILIDKDSFIGFINNSCRDIECSISICNELYKNLVFTIIYVPEYYQIDSDVWRCILLEVDKLLVVLNVGHLLYTGELDFIKSKVLPYYSPNRLLFAIGNAQHIKSSEWKDAVARFKLKIGEEYDVFPIFTEIVSPERLSRYLGYERNLSNILCETSAKAIELRTSHFVDIDMFKMNLFEQLLMQLKGELEEVVSLGESAEMAAQENMDLVTKSKKHIEDNLSLFLETPLLASSRNAIDGFSKAFKVSLKEDITASSDIKKDAGYLTRYMSAIWTQFLEEQNALLYKKFEHEASLLMTMMKLDLRSITLNVHNVNVREKIKAKLEDSFNVNTFFSRKLAVGNSLTDALTIGGIISGILISPVGFVAVVASELIKVLKKDSINDEYKEELKTKVDDIIERNKEEILQQAELRFSAVTKEFHDEIMKFYDELLLTVNKIVAEERKRKLNATETIEKINTLI